MAKQDACSRVKHNSLYVRICDGDSVAVALQDIKAGDPVSDAFVASESIPAGHKFALSHIEAGAPIYKGDWLIGTASRAITPGEWVHTHNLCDATDEAGAPVLTPIEPNTNKAFFQGYRRADGRVGTRNYLAVCVVGNCAATAARRIAEWFTPERLAPFANVDGVVPLIHEFGCGMEMTGEPMDLLRRTLAASSRHPNVAGTLVVALGCERNNIYGFLEQEELTPNPLLRTLVLQEVGGTLEAIQQGVSALEEMLPLADSIQREQVPASSLTVGLLHHGLNSYAALTASPALAIAVDMLIAQNGTVVTSNTPATLKLSCEVSNRATSQQVAQQLNQRFDWWRQYHAGRDTRLKNGRLPQGAPLGISSSREQAAIALHSVGSSPLSSVVNYGEQVNGPGWIFMDSPSYEGVAATGMVAGGVTLLSLATGDGSAFGAALAPTIKTAASSDVYAHWEDDIDLNAGAMLTEDISAADMGRRIFEYWIACASGQLTCDESLGIGKDEFSPWPIGVLA